MTDQKLIEIVEEEVHQLEIKLELRRTELLMLKTKRNESKRTK